MFHHGFGGGGDTVIYGVIKPKVVLWPGAANRVTEIKNAVQNEYFVNADEVSGIKYYLTKNSSVVIFHFTNGKAVPTVYEDFNLYKAS